MGCDGIWCLCNQGQQRDRHLPRGSSLPRCLSAQQAVWLRHLQASRAQRGARLGQVRRRQQGPPCVGPGVPSGPLEQVAHEGHEASRRHAPPLGLRWHARLGAAQAGPAACSRASTLGTKLRMRPAGASSAAGPQSCAIWPSSQAGVRGPVCTKLCSSGGVCVWSCASRYAQAASAARLAKSRAQGSCKHAGRAVDSLRSQRGSCWLCAPQHQTRRLGYESPATCCTGRCSACGKHAALARQACLPCCTGCACRPESREGVC